MCGAMRRARTAGSCRGRSRITTSVSKDFELSISVEAFQGRWGGRFTSCTVQALWERDHSATKSKGMVEARLGTSSCLDATLNLADHSKHFGTFGPHLHRDRTVRHHWTELLGLRRVAEPQSSRMPQPTAVTTVACWRLLTSRAGLSRNAEDPYQLDL